MVWVKLLVIAVCGYMLGNISAGMIISNHLAKIDIRQHGSKYTGATNMFRVLGAKASLLTLFGDALKGALACLLGLWLLGRDGVALGGVFLEGPIGVYLGGICAVLGHMWPVVYKFRGGKGVATCLGVALVVDPVVALVMLAITLAIIFTTRIVSVASLTILAVYAAYYLITGWGNWPLCIFVVLMMALVYFAHRSNIRRILNGTEKNNRLDFSKIRRKGKAAE